MTIRGLFREFVAAIRRHRIEVDERKWLAWHGAAFARADVKLPALDKFMRRVQAQTREEMDAMWRQIGDRFGTRRKHKKGSFRIIRGNG